MQCLCTAVSGDFTPAGSITRIADDSHWRMVSLANASYVMEYPFWL